MFLSLIPGILLGAVSVVFLLQNMEVVTVSFLTWQITASLALILFVTLLSGIFIMALVLTPSLIGDSFRMASIKRQKKALEEEVTELKAATPPVVVDHVV